MTPEEFDRKRRETIELLHPELRKEMQGCAEAMDMTFDEFMEHLRCVVESVTPWSYYQDVGENEAYKNFDWTRIWMGYELLTGTTIPPNTYGRYPGSGFNCSC